MFEEEVVQEESVQEPVPESNPEIQPQEQEINPAKQPSQPKADKEINFKALREKTARLERERDEALRKVQEIEARKIAQQEPDEDFTLNIQSDALAEGKDLQKLQRQILKQQQELAKINEQTRNISILQRLKSEHPDIDAVVTTDNLKMLSEAYPEIAQALNSSSDAYSKIKSAYTMIKKFGIIPEDSEMIQKEKIKENLAKPRPISSISPQTGDAPLERVNAFAQGLTPELRKQLWKEMQENIKKL